MTDASNVIAAGLMREFDNTYTNIMNRQADGRLAMVMDLEGPQATTRSHDFGYWETAPYLERWIRGEAIPQESMFSKTFNVKVHNWGKAVTWHQDDREDDVLQGLLQAANRLAESAGNLQEQAFFDLLLATQNVMPGTSTAPDGSAMHVTTSRFGVAGGNTSTAVNGVAATDDILTDYYHGISILRSMQDTKGQPLWTPDVMDQGVVIIYGSANEQVFEQAFLQQRHVGQVATAATSNIVQDASRNVTLWSTSRITTNDWYIFLKGAPVKSTFVLNRRGIRAQPVLAGANNSDELRNNGLERVQWDLRQGFAINTAYSTVKIDNA